MVISGDLSPIWELPRSLYELFPLPWFTTDVYLEHLGKGFFPLIVLEDWDVEGTDRGKSAFMLSFHLRMLTGMVALIFTESIPYNNKTIFALAEHMAILIYENRLVKLPYTGFSGVWISAIVTRS